MHPLVSCILLFGVAQRTRLAFKAIRQFLWQAYPAKELVIVNTTGVPLLQQGHAEIVEVHAEPCTLAAMRNVGLAHAAGRWHTPWDDDDCYHPFRLWYQLSQCATEGRAVLLANQVRFNYKTGTAFVHRDVAGIPSTGLYPLSPGARYADGADEDVTFYRTFWQHDAVVLDNLHYPLNCLSVAVHHGHNVQPVEKFMRQRCRPEDARKWYLGVDETAYLRHALGVFGVPITLQEEQPAAKEATPG